MTWEPPADQPKLGEELLKRYRIRSSDATHQLFEVPPMSTRKNLSLDWNAIRRRLPAGGKQFWRGLEELADTEEFREMVHREFPEQASEWTNPITRRRFLMLMGASLALAGLSGCGAQPPAGRIMPYVRQPGATGAWQAVVLRHGDAPGRAGDRPAGGEP